MTWSINALCQQRLAREKGTVFKDPGGRVQVALAYPNTYYVGMSNLGFLTLYRWLNDFPDVVAERVFLPDEEEAELYAKSGSELVALESQRPISSFDVVAFSLSFENDYVNILTLLDLAKIPSQNTARLQGHPLLLAGGVATFLNPEPLAPFFDLFLIGEAEALLDDLVPFLREFRDHRSAREELLQSVCNRPGFYVPSLYRVEYDPQGRIDSFTPTDGAPPRVVRARATEGRRERPASSLSTSDTEFSDMALIEVERACGRGCRFCAAGYVYRPVRSIDPGRALAEIDSLLNTVSRVGLIGPGLADIPYLDEVLTFIEGKGATASLSSVRADGLDDKMLLRLSALGQKSLAIAPEAGSQRMRNVLNKDLDTEQILDAALAMARSGLKTIKLYFMIGLPTEEPEDVEAIPELVKQMRHHVLKHRAAGWGMPLFSVSVSCFVPKPHTPFQWEPMERVASLKAKLAVLRSAFARIKGVKFNHEPPKWAFLQSLLSTGDRRVSRIIREAASENGRWKEAFSRTDVNPEFYVYRKRDTDELLPWDFIDHGIRKEYLIEEYRNALAGRRTRPCEPGHCRRCGIC